MRTTFYLAAALWVAVLAPAARAEHYIGLQFGRHEYSGSFEQSVLGVSYDYQFKDSALSLGGAADYLSADFGGDPGARGFRIAPAANLHIQFGCLPIDVVPGVGIDYTHLEGTRFDREDAVGPYGRLRVLIRIVEEVSAGLNFRKSYSVFDSLGQEAAVVVQFNVIPKKKKPVRRPTFTVQHRMGD